MRESREALSDVRTGRPRGGSCALGEVVAHERGQALSEAGSKVCGQAAPRREDEWVLPPDSWWRGGVARDRGVCSAGPSRAVAANSNGLPRVTWGGNAVTFRAARLSCMVLMEWVWISALRRAGRVPCMVRL